VGDSHSRGSKPLATLVRPAGRNDAELAAGATETAQWQLSCALPGETTHTPVLKTPQARHSFAPGARDASSLRPEGARSASFLRPGGARSASFLRPEGARSASFLRPEGARSASFLRPEGARPLPGVSTPGLEVPSMSGRPEGGRGPMSMSFVRPPGGEERRGKGWVARIPGARSPWQCSCALPGENDAHVCSQTPQARRSFAGGRATRHPFDRNAVVSIQATSRAWKTCSSRTVDRSLTPKRCDRRLRGRSGARAPCSSTGAEARSWCDRLSCR
jgi:hypothetical protein